jgi:hypothetical protein
MHEQHTFLAIAIAMIKAEYYDVKNLCGVMTASIQLWAMENIYICKHHHNVFSAITDCGY